MCEKIDFDSEYALQHLTNERLKILFNLKYITHEFQFKGFKINGLELNDEMESLRIDGLAFDEKANAFVIIEYKNSLNEKVFEQGKNYYYNLIETFDGHFKEDSNSKDEIDTLEKKYCEQVNKNKDKLRKRYEKAFNKVLEGDDCFSNAKVLIIGPEFNNIQKISEAPNYPHEIYKVSLYKNDEINGHVLYEGVNIDFEKRINVNLGNLKLTKCTLLQDKTDEIKELYNNFELNLLNQCDDLDDLDIKYMVDFVSIKAHKKYICRVDVKKSIKIHYYIDKEEYGDETLTQGNIDDVICSIRKVYNQKVSK